MLNQTVITSSWLVTASASGDSAFIRDYWSWRKLVMAVRKDSKLTWAVSHRVIYRYSKTL